VFGIRSKKDYCAGIMNVRRLFCINFGRHSKPGRTEKLQIDDDKCAEGRNDRVRRRNSGTDRDGKWRQRFRSGDNGAAGCNCKIYVEKQLLLLQSKVIHIITKNERRAPNIQKLKVFFNFVHNESYILYIYLLFHKS